MHDSLNWFGITLTLIPILRDFIALKFTVPISIMIYKSVYRKFEFTCTMDRKILDFSKLWIPKKHFRLLFEPYIARIHQKPRRKQNLYHNPKSDKNTIHFYLFYFLRPCLQKPLRPQL